MVCFISVFKSPISPLDAGNSKEPNRMKFGATLATIAPCSKPGLPLYSMSLLTKSPLRHKDKALVVGTPKWYMASEHKYSLILDLNTANPSADLEYGVGPAPFN